MNHKNYFTVTSVIFLLVAIMHGLRIVSGWQAEIGGWMVPMWASWVAVVVGLGLSYQGMKFGKN